MNGFYLILLVLEVGAMLIHGAKEGLEGIDEIVEYDHSPLLAFGLAEAARMNDTHLLQHG